MPSYSDHKAFGRDSLAGRDRVAAHGVCGRTSVVERTRKERVMAIARPIEAAKKIPPLQNGDRLTSAEFERRYDAMPNLKKAELIEGVVYMPSPVSFEEHGAPHFDVISWLGMYRMMTPGIRGGDNASLRLDLDNMPQPDAF